MNKIMEYDLNAVRQFIKVAENLSFTVAAQQLDVTQSGISRAVNRLESQLGLRLLHRNTRNLKLTVDGELFLKRVKPLVGGLEEAHQELLEYGLEPKGSLKISAPSAFGRVVVMPIVAKLLDEYPQLTIELVLTDRVVDLVGEGFDAVIRSGNIQDSRVIARPLKAADWVTVASPKYLESYGSPKELEELATHNCMQVRNPATGQLFPWTFRNNEKDADFPIRGSLVVDHGDPLVEAALLSIGMAQLMTFFVEDYLKDGLLTPVLNEYARSSTPLTLLYPSARHRSAKLMMFRDALLEHWGGRECE